MQMTEEVPKTAGLGVLRGWLQVVVLSVTGRPLTIMSPSTSYLLSAPRENILCTSCSQYLPIVFLPCVIGSRTLIDSYQGASILCEGPKETV